VIRGLRPLLESTNDVVLNILSLSGQRKRILYFIVSSHRVKY